MKKYRVSMLDGFTRNILAVSPDEAEAEAVAVSMLNLESWPLVPLECRECITVRSIELMET